MFPLRDDQPSFSTPYVTYFLIALNLLIFFWEWSIEAANPHALNQLIYQFGVIPQVDAGLLLGTPRFAPGAAILPMFTSMFLHAGWIHVLGNMWMLWIFGDNIEDYLGHFPYLVFYLLCGLAAAVTHILFNLHSRVPTVGASGAIAGVMGAYLILYPRARVLVWVFVFVFYVPAWLMLGFWAITQFASGAAVSIETATQGGGVAFWAHVGGFVAGIALVKIFPQRQQRERYAAW